MVVKNAVTIWSPVQLGLMHLPTWNVGAGAVCAGENTKLQSPWNWDWELNHYNYTELCSGSESLGVSIRIHVAVPQSWQLNPEVLRQQAAVKNQLSVCFERLGEHVRVRSIFSCHEQASRDVFDPQNMDWVCASCSPFCVSGVRMSFFNLAFAARVDY